MSNVDKYVKIEMQTTQPFSHKSTIAKQVHKIR